MRRVYQIQGLLQSGIAYGKTRASGNIDILRYSCVERVSLLYCYRDEKMDFHAVHNTEVVLGSRRDALGFNVGLQPCLHNAGFSIRVPGSKATAARYHLWRHKGVVFIEYPFLNRLTIGGVT